MITGPLVSVLMTTYNRELYIGEAIKSVLSSTYKDYELIITDDGSSDRTVQIAREFEIVDSRIRVYVNEKNLGDYPNRNRAASYATGKYLKYLDSDDIIYSWGLQAMVYCMEQNPSAVLGLTSNVSLNKKYPVLLSPVDAYKMYFFQNMVLGIGPTGTIIRRDIFEKSNGFNGKQFTGDTDLWLRITQKNDSIWMAPGLFYWRTHEQQQIAIENKNIGIDAIRHRLHVDFLTSLDCPLSKEDVGTALRNLKNIKCRALIMEFAKGRIAGSLIKKKKLGLTLVDFAYAIKKNKIPSAT
jgi:glycosyltransferase involved in cell wall biosynthesis